MNVQSFLAQFGLEVQGLDHQFSDEDREFLKDQNWYFKSTGGFCFVGGVLVWVTGMTEKDCETRIDNLVGGRLFGDDNNAISCE